MAIKRKFIMKSIFLKETSVKSDDECRRRLFNVCCKLFNTPHSALTCHSLPQGARECGRSMIEMLGVLAIIGVLSVGGIAGYSKAMEKFKLNKTINEYSYLIYGLLEHIDDLRSVPVGMGQFNFTSFAQAINIVPSSWTAENNMAMWDNSGNIVQVLQRRQCFAAGFLFRRLAGYREWK